jgi:endonuclease G
LPPGQAAGGLIDYTHHSVILNFKRKFAFLSASNIDGNSWQPIERSGDFVKDSVRTQTAYQWGSELYRQMGVDGPRGVSAFDKGHLTAYQEVLWGPAEESSLAAKDTMYYTNCVPQHSLLNKGAWKSLEQFIIRKGIHQGDARLCVFTGPVFNPGDPWLTAQIDGQNVRIPTTFWKVIYYTWSDRLHAVGFMMSHEELLLQAGIITFEEKMVRPRTPPDIMMLFPKATAYQVKVSLISEFTGLYFQTSGVEFPYTSENSKEIVYKRIEVRREEGTTNARSRGPGGVETIESQSRGIGEAKQEEADAGDHDFTAAFDLEGLTF